MSFWKQYILSHPKTSLRSDDGRLHAIAGNRKAKGIIYNFIVLRKFDSRCQEREPVELNNPNIVEDTRNLVVRENSKVISRWFRYQLQDDIFFQISIFN